MKTINLQKSKSKIVKLQRKIANYNPDYQFAN